MIVIGSRISFRQGPAAALELAGQLELALGPAGRWIFLAGFWGAVFSSLLGVWQSVPYLFADFVTLPGRLAAPDTTPVDLETTRTYRVCLVAITVVPLAQLALTVQRAQLLYAVMGAFFMPLLACTLLILNSRRELDRRTVAERLGHEPGARGHPAALPLRGSRGDRRRPGGIPLELAHLGSGNRPARAATGVTTSTGAATP